MRGREASFLSGRHPRAHRGAFLLSQLFQTSWGTFASQSLDLKCSQSHPRRETLSIFFLRGVTPSGMWNFRSQRPKPCPLRWKHKVLITGSPGSPTWSILFYLNIYLFTWLRQVSAAACGIFGCGIRTPSCGTWDLFS